MMSCQNTLLALKVTDSQLSRRIKTKTHLKTPNCSLLEEIKDEYNNSPFLYA